MYFINKYYESLNDESLKSIIKTIKLYQNTNDSCYKSIFEQHKNMVLNDIINNVNMKYSDFMKKINVDLCYTLDNPLIGCAITKNKNIFIRYYLPAFYFRLNLNNELYFKTLNEHHSTLYHECIHYEHFKTNHILDKNDEEIKKYLSSNINEIEVEAYTKELELYNQYIKIIPKKFIIKKIIKIQNKEWKIKKEQIISKEYINEKIEEINDILYELKKQNYNEITKEKNKKYLSFINTFFNGVAK